MASKNMCKFPASLLTDTLNVHCFVLETEPEVMQEPVQLTSNKVMLVTSGEGGVTFDDTYYELCTGTLLFGFTGERFCVTEPRELSYLYLQFDGTRADELFHRFGINEHGRRFAKMDGLIPILHESLLRASELTIDLAAESMLLYIFSRLSGMLTPQNDLVNRILCITDESFTDPNLSLSGIAAELSYHPKYLSHIFKERQGMGYTEYLCRLRIKFAVSLFDRGIDSVKNVAWLSGFTDPLYFSTVFKKKMGVSPSEYKKTKRGEASSKDE